MKKLILIIVLPVALLLRVFSQSFTDSNLPIIIITTDGGAGIPDEPRVYGNMKVIFRGEGQRNYVADKDNPLYLNYNGRISIEARGSSSQSTPKKQYALATLMPDDTTDNNVKLLGLPSENDWILNGMVFDPVLMRDYICYNLSRKMGEYASRTVYCEAIINNAYAGLYLLEEKIKPGPDRVNVIKIDKADFFQPNLTGGYITKADKTTGGDPVAWTMPTFGYNDYAYFIHVLPKPENVTAIQNNYIKGQFDRLDVEAFNGNISFEDGYPTVIDVASFVNYMISAEFSSNADSYQFSTYYHKDRNGKLRAGPIWDNDLTFGNDLFFWSLDRSHTDVWQFANGDNQGPYFWSKLFSNREFQCSLARRWKELTSPGQPLCNDSLSAFLDRTANYISEAVARNNALWGNSQPFISGVAAIKNFMVERTIWINNQMASAGSCPDPVIPPLVITKIMYHPDSTGAFPKPKDYEFIEIKNNSSKIVSLSGDYFLGTGFVYQFPPYSYINPGGIKVLASNEGAFRLKYGFAPSGQFTRNLSNGSEKLVLADGFGSIIDYVKYSDSLPWPDADGNGAYLELIEPSLDNNDPVNWVANHNSVVSAGITPEKERIRIYPVPARDHVYLQSDELFTSIELYNMQGVLIRSEEPNSSEFDLEIAGCQPGIYYIKITTNSGIRVRKIVKE